MARPLYIADQSAPDAALNSEYLLGTDLLVAPILDPGAVRRTVYLPAGDAWQRHDVTPDGHLQPVGRPVPGGTTITALATLDQVPVFVRVGSRVAGGLPLTQRGPTILPNTEAPSAALVTASAIGLAVVVLAAATIRRRWSPKNQTS
ncbi:MAG: hypothetical protein ACR2MY_03080 [Candidatus Dormibacteria bacterium]